MASKAAVNAALADQSAANESSEAGEIQEVDMQAQADGIRTVFSDPTNFNVKVSPCVDRQLLLLTRSSIPCTLHGLFGSTLRRQKVAISHRLPFLLFRLRLRRTHLVSPPRKDGWRISSG